MVIKLRNIDVYRDLSDILHISLKTNTGKASSLLSKWHFTSIARGFEYKSGENLLQYVSMVRLHLVHSVGFSILTQK